MKHLEQLGDVVGKCHVSVNELMRQICWLLGDGYSQDLEGNESRIHAEHLAHDESVACTLHSEIHNANKVLGSVLATLITANQNIPEHRSKIETLSNAVTNLGEVLVPYSIDLPVTESDGLPESVDKVEASRIRNVISDTVIAPIIKMHDSLDSLLFPEILVAVIAGGGVTVGGNDDRRD